MFIKAGFEGGNGKNGYNVAAGIDIPLRKRWHARVQNIHYCEFKEDYGDPPENEDQLPIGLHYRF